MNLFFLKFFFNNFLFSNWLIINVVFSVFNGIRILDIIKFILLNIVLVLKCKWFRLLKDNVVGILMINISILFMIVIFCFLLLLFLVKLDIFNFNNDIEDVNVVNKNNSKNIK